ncbi:MAG: SDR family oxidoreductase [Chloroflexi bacterium]|nr:SDR family oxidoreductase [Chloroflexota bacterium]
MKILVAGGAGFIGSHLCERLLAEGDEVYCLDNLSTGQRANIEPLAGQSRFHFREADVSESLADEPAVDAIFHLASPASPPGYFQRPLETMLANSLGTHRLLALAQRQGARLLFASTSEVYGDPLEHPQSETYWGNVNPVGMRSCYDESKRFGEAITMVYVQKYGVDARVVRIFNTYGPRSDPDDGRLVPNFVTQALRGTSLTVYGDGSQTRSLCYVSDLVEGLVRALRTPGTRGGIFNLGNPDEHTILEYAQIIKRQTASPSPIVFVDMPSEDEPTRRKPDIARAREVLGWEPKVGLSEGLDRTIAWFRERLDR